MASERWYSGSAAAYFVEILALCDATVALALRVFPNLYRPRAIHFAPADSVSKDQLQVYLDEFVFRHNRRKTPAAAFQTLLGLGTARKSIKYEQIRKARDLRYNRLGLAEATG
jgi:hypothetical protein